MTKRWLTVLAALLAACSSQNGEPAAPELPAHSVEAQLDETFRLTPGQTARVGNVFVRFDGVVADSRCPTDVTCVWSGNARIVLAVATTRADGWTRLELNTHEGAREGPAGGHTLTLVELRPHPQSDRITDRPAYVALLRLSR